MAYCSNCGSKLEENAKFCLACGAPVEQTNTDTNTNTLHTAPVENTTPAPAKASGVLNMVQLVWSLINLLLCCTPLGIASLIMAILAKDAPSAEEEAKKLKTAKICNLIGTIVGAVIIIVYAFVFVAAFIFAEY